MSGVNKVILIGRLGAEPEMRNTAGGSPVCTLSLATSESWVKDGKKEEKTEWHRVVLWGRLAELAQKYLKKGRMVYIEGRLQTRSWQDPQGQKRYSTEIVANSMQFIDGGSRDGQEMPSYEDAPNGDFYGQSSGSNMYGSSDSSSKSNRSMDDDIPF